MEGGKTANATRTLRIAVPVAQSLLMRQFGRAADAWLFGDGRAWQMTIFGTTLTRVCKRLALPHVCPHSLRGMHATFAVQDGASAEHVASVLGHGSTEITDATTSPQEASRKPNRATWQTCCRNRPQTCRTNPEALLKLPRNEPR